MTFPEPVNFLPIQTPVQSDAITNHFSCGDAGPCDSSLNTDTPRIEIIDPNNPLGGRNLEYRNNWSIISVQGVDELVDAELTTVSSQYRSGVTIKGKRRKERRINISVQICPCESCSIMDQRRELYETVECNFCDTSNCSLCCDGGEYLCLDDLEVRDQRYCIMRIRCCDVVRDISVERVGNTELTKTESGCEIYTFSFLAPTPNFHYPALQTQLVELTGQDVDCQQNPDPESCNNPICSFEKCFELPYLGNVRGYPKITIVGRVVNFQIENTDNGSTLSFGDLERENYVLNDWSGCGRTTANLLRGQRSFTDLNGEDIFGDLSEGCDNQFSFDKYCGQNVNLCIRGDEVDFQNFRVVFEWWNEFDGFYKVANEPEFSTPVCVEADINTTAAPFQVATWSNVNG